MVNRDSLTFELSSFTYMCIGYGSSNRQPSWQKPRFFHFFSFINFTTNFFPGQILGKVNGKIEEQLSLKGMSEIRIGIFKIQIFQTLPISPLRLLSVSFWVVIIAVVL